MDASSWTNNASYAIDIAEKHHLSQTTSSDVHTTAEKRRFKLNPERERENNAFIGHSDRTDELIRDLLLKSRRTAP